jgi:hypothetical protein
MGYTTAPYSVFASDMKQTPENVAKVLDVAGWNVLEAAKEASIGPLMLRRVIDGDAVLPDEHWKRLLDVAGRRAFDFGCDEEI